MGLLRDKYFINKTEINTDAIAIQMKRKNNIQEEQNAILNNTRNRVDISLNEYENLKSELKSKTELLDAYEKKFQELAEHLNVSLEALLSSKILKSEVERNISKMTYNLYVVFELGDK